MPNYRRMTTQAARRYGLDPRVFRRQIYYESGFQPHVVSPAGARGIAQIMPGTAAGWGVNPDNPRAALNAAAKHMAGFVRQYGSYEKALRAYNAGAGNLQKSYGFPETNKYVRNILQGRDPGSLNAPNASIQIGGGGGANTQSALPQALNVAALLSTLGDTSRPRPTASGTPDAPAFAAQPVTPQGYASPVSAAPPQRTDYASALNSLMQAAAQSRSQLTSLVAGGGGGGGTLQNRGGLGKVTVASGANRAGVGLQPEVRQFVRRVAGIDNRPLTIGTGSNHSQYTVNGTVSDHWRGAAADIPLAGKALVRAGRAALIAAGMSPKRARKINGGGFNVGGWQVIFNTNAPGWGDHTDHLHVGRRG